MRKLGVVLFIPTMLLGGGCEDYFEAVADREDYRSAFVTPNGLHYEYQGSPTDVAERLDRAYVRAGEILETRYGFPLQDFLRLPHDERLIFYIIDHTRFEVGGIYARGLRDGREITVVYWATSALTLYDAIPADAPAWTVRESVANPGFWYYGYINDEDLAALLAHEVGHYIYGPTFEH